MEAKLTPSNGCEAKAGSKAVSSVTRNTFNPEGIIKNIELDDNEKDIILFDKEALMNVFYTEKVDNFATSFDIQLALQNLGIPKSLAHINALLENVQDRHDIGKVSFIEFCAFVKREEAKMIRENTLVENAKHEMKGVANDISGNVMDGTMEVSVTSEAKCTSRDSKTSTESNALRNTFNPEGIIKDVELDDDEQGIVLFDKEAMMNAFYTDKVENYASSLDIQSSLENMGIPKSLAHINALLEKVQDKHDIGKVSFGEFCALVKREEAKLIRENTLVINAKREMKGGLEDISPNIMDGTMEGPAVSQPKDKSPGNDRSQSKAPREYKALQDAKTGSASNTAYDNEMKRREDAIKSTFWAVCTDRDEKIDGVQVSDALHELLGSAPRSRVLFQAMQTVGLDDDGRINVDQFVRVVDTFLQLH